VSYPLSRRLPQVVPCPLACFLLLVHFVAAVADPILQIPHYEFPVVATFCLQNATADGFSTATVPTIVLLETLKVYIFLIISSYC